MRRVLSGWAIAWLALFVSDAILVELAIDGDVAAALLSPSSAVSLGAFAIALSFLLVRVALVASVPLGAAHLAWSATRSWRKGRARLAASTLDSDGAAAMPYRGGGERG
ncbi:MAG: hypothetical protein AB7S26_01320 [Sandaracinaceae bacterium]